jgi:hypothetical protein
VHRIDKAASTESDHRQPSSLRFDRDESEIFVLWIDQGARTPVEIR